MIGEDRAGLELAVVLEENVHGSEVRANVQRRERDYTGAKSRSRCATIGNRGADAAKSFRACRTPSSATNSCRHCLSRSAFAQAMTACGSRTQRLAADRRS